MKKLLMAVLCIISMGITKPIWVRDNVQDQWTNKYRGVCVINDSLAWVVGDSGYVWKRTSGIHSHTWTQITNLPQGYTNYHLNDVFFVDSNTGRLAANKYELSTSRFANGIYFYIIQKHS